MSSSTASQAGQLAAPFPQLEDDAHPAHVFAEKLLAIDRMARATPATTRAIMRMSTTRGASLSPYLGTARNRNVNRA